MPTSLPPSTPLVPCYNCWHNQAFFIDWVVSFYYPPHRLNRAPCYKIPSPLYYLIKYSLPDLFAKIMRPSRLTAHILNRTIIFYFLKKREGSYSNYMPCLSSMPDHCLPMTTPVKTVNTAVKCLCGKQR